VGSKAVVVSKTDKLDRLARRTIKNLGGLLQNGPAVKASVRRFGDEVAARPAALRVHRLDVVGFELEPVVIHEGIPQPVRQAFPLATSEYWVGSDTDLERGERGIIASLARRIAERVVLCEAMMAAIAQADPDLVLSAVRCDSATVSVELIGDEDGRVAKRLPAWIKARSSE